MWNFLKVPGSQKNFRTATKFLWIFRLNCFYFSKAKTGTYLDKKCPFTSDVSIRGRLMFAEVHSTRMQNTIICRKSYLHYDKKYKRFEKRHKNIPAHISPAFEPFKVKKGDRVTIGECRPLSKTVSFNVLAVHKDLKKLKAFEKF